MQRKDGLPQNRPSTYGYGIARRNRRKPWIVKFRRHKLDIHVGTYLTYREAVAARDAYLRTHWQ